MKQKFFERIRMDGSVMGKVESREAKKKQELDFFDSGLGVSEGNNRIRKVQEKLSVFDFLIREKVLAADFFILDLCPMGAIHISH